MMGPSDGFPVTATDLCRTHEIAPVVDEVISFRLTVGGLTSERGVNADLVCLGKIIGGSLPAGAVVGKPEWMEMLNPYAESAVEHGGTHICNPASLAADAVARDMLDGDPIKHLDHLGHRFRNTMRDPSGRLE